MNPFEATHIIPVLIRERQGNTGQFVTPLPQGLYVTERENTVKLKSGKDFNLTCKDNVNVGNAECTIHGKDPYRRTKTVTFIISRT
jgi:hypothetical protein